MVFFIQYQFPFLNSSWIPASRPTQLYAHPENKLELKKKRKNIKYKHIHTPQTKQNPTKLEIIIYKRKGW